MKHKSTFFIFTFAVCATIALQANDYVMLTPLDTAALPAIPNKDCGGNIVRSALDGNAMWQHTHSNNCNANTSPMRACTNLW